MSQEEQVEPTAVEKPWGAGEDWKHWGKPSPGSSPWPPPLYMVMP